MEYFMFAGTVVKTICDTGQLITIKMSIDECDMVQITVPNYIKTDVKPGAKILAKGKIGKKNLIAQKLYVFE